MCVSSVYTCVRSCPEINHLVHSLHRSELHTLNTNKIHSRTIVLPCNPFYIVIRSVRLNSVSERSLYFHIRVISLRYLIQLELTYTHTSNLLSWSCDARSTPFKGARVLSFNFNQTPDHFVRLSAVLITDVVDTPYLFNALLWTLLQAPLSTLPLRPNRREVPQPPSPVGNPPGPPEWGLSPSPMWYTELRLPSLT